MKARVDELRRGVAPVLTCTGRVEQVQATGDVDDDGFPVVVRTVIYDGRCLIYPADRDARAVISGLASYVIGRYVVLFPHSAEVKVGHRIELTASPDSPDLIGAEFRITDAPFDAWAILRHCVADRVENR